MRNAKTLSDVSTAIANREEFRFTTMHGYHTNAPVPAGYSMEFANKVNDAIRAMKQVYVIYSYGTPIAAEINGEAVITDEKFSVTTSRHTNLAKLALSLS